MRARMPRLDPSLSKVAEYLYSERLLESEMGSVLEEVDSYLFHHWSNAQKRPTTRAIHPIISITSEVLSAVISEIICSVISSSEHNLEESQPVV